MSTVEFDKLLSAMKITSTVLLDVRNVSELADDGRIPGSVNIPLPEISAAFQMSPEMFSEKYSFSLPDKESESLILTCRSASAIMNRVIIGLSNQDSGYIFSDLANEHSWQKDSWRNWDSRMLKYMRAAFWTGRQKGVILNKNF